MMTYRYKRIISIVLVCMLIAGSNVASYGVKSELNNDAIYKGIKYLQDIQNEDAGFSVRKGEKSSVTLSCWVAMALTAVGEDTRDQKWLKNNVSISKYIKANSGDISTSLDYAKLLMVLTATNEDAVHNGVDIAKLIMSFQQDNGFIGQADEKDMVNVHMWNVLALVSADENDYDKHKALEWLISCQNEDGGFGFAKSVDSDVDDTGIALHVLVLLEEDNASSSLAIENAKSFLLSNYNEDGGFDTGQWMETESNTASTAWALQGLYATDLEIVNKSDWQTNAENSTMFLYKMQKDEGYFSWKKDNEASKTLMTAYALLALSHKPFPININYSVIQNMPFADVDYSHWAAQAIVDLYNDRIINGYPDGSFNPSGSVSRGEFTAMIVKAFLYETDDTNMTFVDVNKTDWTYDYVLKAYSAGIVNGRSKTIFDQEGKISGGELATMLVNVIASKKDITIINDSSIWYKGNELFVKNIELLAPTYDGDKNATREECAYSIKKLLEYMSK